jgi:hypothetical protein
MPATARTVAQVEFYWPGYDPEKALDLFEDTPIESFTPRQGVQIDYPGATTGAVYNWMSIHNLRVFSTARIGQRRRGRWEGYYRVTFAINTREEKTR